MTGVFCDRKVPPEENGKSYRTIVRPTMLYGIETIVVKKSQEKQMERTEMKMLRFSLWIARRDRIRNEEVRKQVKVEKLSDKLCEVRLQWLGYVKGREETYVVKRDMAMMVGKRKREKPRRR